MWNDKTSLTSCKIGCKIYGRHRCIRCIVLEQLYFLKKVTVGLLSKEDLKTYWAVLVMMEEIVIVI